MLGVLMLDIAGFSLTAEDRELLKKSCVGGVILFSRNYQSPQQVHALCEDIHSLRQPPLLIAVDQEGGIVQRFRDGFTALPAMLQLGHYYDENPEAALQLTQQVGWLMAAELRAVGIDFSFAPILDIHLGISRVIDSRAFHRQPDIIARLAQALIKGMKSAGMHAVGKHFPGHGSVTADSHHSLPEDNRDLSDIRQRDLRPFDSLIQAGIPALMPAHVLYSKVDDQAAGFSSYWLQTILRQELGFQGVIFSDDLSMAGAAMAGNIEQRAEKALNAGCDMLLVCNDRTAARQVIHYLKDYENPAANARLVRLHGWHPKPKLGQWQTLQQSQEWQNAVQALNVLHDDIELNLKDDDMN